MLLISPIALLLLMAVLMAVLRQFRPQFGYFWLIAALAALFAWPLVFLQRWRLPWALPLTTWEPANLFPVSPALLGDSLSWPFSLALASMLVAVILTDVVRAAEADWFSWFTSLAITGIGLFTVQAANLLTLILGWAALDLFELLYQFAQHSSNRGRERVVVIFSTRVAGIFMAVWAGMVARSSSSSVAFQLIGPQIGPFLLLAAGLRLGIFPLNLAAANEPPVRRASNILISLVTAATSLVLLARTGAAGVPSAWAPWLLALTGLAAMVGAIFWAMAQNDLTGRTYWILGLASFSVASAIQAESGASLAWGLALLLSGALLFLASSHHPLLLPFFILGILGFSALPFTPAWQGVRLYAALILPFQIPFIIAQAILIAGYLRHALRERPSLTGIERWVWVIYPLGLVLLPITQQILLWGSPQTPSPTAALGALTSFWPALAALLIAGLIVTVWARGVRLPRAVYARLQSTFSLEWLYRQLWVAYRYMSRPVGFINLVLEGEGGLLWTMLLLTLLIALLLQTGAGG